MARELHYRKKDNKYALWSTIVDDYVTEWEDKEEIRKQWYLDKFKSAMKDIDALYMCDGWREARGCQIEYEVAMKYGIKILYSDFFENREMAVSRNFEEG